MKVSDIFQPVPPEFGIGSYVKIYGVVYVVCKPAIDLVGVVSIVSGNRWSDAVRVKDHTRLTESEAKALLNNGYDSAEIVTKKEALDFLVKGAQ